MIFRSIRARWRRRHAATALFLVAGAACLQVLFFVPTRNTLGLKRVVGIAGDRVEIRENRLIVNGQAEKYRPLTRAVFDVIPAEHHLGSVVMLEGSDSM